MSASVANGELKSKTVANDMAGGGAAVATVNTGPVANSQTSIPKDNKSTTTIDLAKVEQSLQIMRDCIDMVRGDGVATEIAPFISKSGKRCVLVVLQDVDYANDDFTFIGSVASGK